MNASLPATHRKMRTILMGIGLAIFLIPVAATAGHTQAAAVSPSRKEVPDARQLEKELQSLNWKQFRSVIEAIPPIRAEVDKYGPLGWQYVRQNYQAYPWRRSIVRLAEWQRIELSRLIAQARKVG